MKLTILGSGVMLPTAQRFPSAFLLQTENQNILLDCGHGALARLTEFGLDPRSIDLIFLSHFHTDHAADAFPLVHARFCGNLYEAQKTILPLTFLGPDGTEENFKKWRDIFWRETTENYPLHFWEGSDDFEFGNIQVSTFPVRHVSCLESIGVILRYNGKKVVYPGDVGSQHNFDDLVSKSRAADLLIIESGYEFPTPNHFSIDQIIDLSRKAQVKKTLIVHIQPYKEKMITSKIKPYDDILLAEDKMVVKIGKTIENNPKWNTLPGVNNFSQISLNFVFLFFLSTL